MRDSTRELIARVTAGLHAGKTPKEIAYDLGLTHSAVKVLMYRVRDIRVVFVETYRLRYPDKEGPPPKIMARL